MLYQEGIDAHAIDFGGGRTVEMSHAGEIMGIGFVDAKAGVDLRGLPVDVAALVGELQRLDLPLKGVLQDLVPEKELALPVVPVPMSGASAPLAGQTKVQTAEYSQPVPVA